MEANRLNGKGNHVLNAGILRAYDIRGIVGKTLSAKDAYYIGKAFASTVVARCGKANPRIGVGYDGRISSPELQDAMANGISSTGAEAVCVGLGPSPMLYFSVYHLGLDAGVMVTGSHNPPTHNGFKFMLGKKSFFGEDILALGQRIESQDFAEGEGAIGNEEVKSAYIAHLLTAFQGEKATKEMKVAWDAGNGASGEAMAEICKKLPGEHIVLNADIDGTFPAHHPDPTVPENLQQLIDTVRQEGCDFGVAFDGDGDRIGAVDGQGRIIWGDQLLCFYAEDVLRDYPGTTIIADVKASNALFDCVAKMGGEPLMWMTGHSLVKSKMVETGSKLAGEMSGHIFFADRNKGYDDGLYAAVRLLNIAAQSDETITDKVSALPKTYGTPEIRIACPDDRKFTVVEEFEKNLAVAGEDYSTIDGVRVNLEEGWWLLRASNTQAALSLRCEASGEEALVKVKEHMQNYLKQSGVDADLG